MAPAPPASEPAVDRDPRESPPLAHRPRRVSRGNDAGGSGRSTGTPSHRDQPPSYREPAESRPPRDGATLTTRYRTERPRPSARTELVGFVQAP
jgi:hypothetical protein